MGSRMDLHEKLVEALGSEEVYYQPPENVKMQYPSIVYAMDSLPTRYADDLPYMKTKVYTVTFISRNPVDPIFDRISEIRSCRFDRHFVSDNLHHNVFTISNPF